MHLLFGFMMLSSTMIFSDQRILEVTSGLPERTESLARAFFTTSERFQSGHAIAEFAAFGLILVIYVIIKVIQMFGGNPCRGLAEITSFKCCCK